MSRPFWLKALPGPQLEKVSFMELSLFVPEPPSAAIYLTDFAAWLLQFLQQLLHTAWWSGFAWGAASVLLALCGLVLGLAVTSSRRASPARSTQLFEQSPPRRRRSLVLPSGAVLSVPHSPE